MRLWRLIPLLLAGLLLGGCGAAGTGGAPESGPVVTSGALQISGIWVRFIGGVPMEPEVPTSQAHILSDEHEAAGGVGAAYMTIRNSGTGLDRLLRVEGDVAHSIELHTMIDDNGVMRMRPVENVEIPAGGEAALKPGGLHAMMIGMKRSLKPGDSVSLKLTFEQAGTVDVQALVREDP